MASTLKTTVTILGCGNSFGVPRAGNDWGKCNPNNSKNRRTRCSLSIQNDDGHLIIDTGQDFREQMNSFDIKHIDGVLYTHTHGDHILGIDDLRVFSDRQKQPIKIYGCVDTIAYFQDRFRFLFESTHPIYPVILAPNILDPFVQVKIKNIPITPHILDHGTTNAFGYKINDKLAYSVDMHSIKDAKTYESLAGIDTWIVDAGGFIYDQNPVHATIDAVEKMNKKVKAKRVILTVLSSLMDYDEVSETLPEGFELAYDGLQIKI